MAGRGGGSKRVLVGVTGSVAAIKVPELIQRLQEVQEPQAREYKDYATELFAICNMIGMVTWADRSGGGLHGEG